MQFPADHPTKVSISDAAKMVDVTRATMYQHIKEKGISLIEADTKRPKIDVSELARIYGDKLKPLNAANDKPAAANANGKADVITAENLALREKLQIFEQERDRERRLLKDQIDLQQSQIENLQDTLKKEQETVNRVTAMLTDQRTDEQKKESLAGEQAKKWADLEKTVQTLAENQNRTFLQRLFGLGKKAQ
ncbi:MAG: hypothetical protein DI626_10675 [Micavibrio aeruginosavorus]|jgi:hypothetical protein|uniref:Uncharacterized protein n=1 Tax=Micavibrio aeruginosavorus TaxID=349221 RepID=A0A2W5MV43_9BACT|nr:MAG: hypothetical protein DI626_10675 [Micavibrio aeruginosavorus]PZQ45082.1 MAG: hypothetical protein DI551_08545 [Micavibrio aeruginosavorus]